MHSSFLKQCMKIKKFDFPIFLANFPPIQTLPIYTKPFSTHKTSLKNTNLDKALRILDLISPQKTPLIPNNRRNHLRLIQDSFQFTKQHDDVINNVVTNMFDEISRRHDLGESARVLSRALSSCANAHDLSHGIQLHCLAIKTGFFINVYVGTSLINFYSRCRKLGHAYKVFDEMPVRNVVSWTAIISGCAHDWQVDACLDLYCRMRNSGMIPNDYTYVSVLSACTGFGALGQGRNMHCQTVRMGFESYLHISNALVSMYCKCGNMGDAFLVFENIQGKDIISWNSIIVGCSLHGLAMQSLELFEKMIQEKFKPDAITFLGVLSSCRHAGLVEKGKLYFNSMLENGVKPELDHYSCMVDLLGRAGLLDYARDFIEKMPINPNGVIWGSLLSSCRVRGEIWHGIFAAESRLAMEPECASTHVQLANLYASVGCWDQAARLRKVMKDRGLKTNIGYSWIEIKNEVFQFRAEDKSNSSWIEIVGVVDLLGDHMRSLGYVPEINDLEF